MPLNDIIKDIETVEIPKDYDIIQVKQLPVIEERLRTLKAEIEEKTSIALAMECTEKTVKSVKETRAELTKEFKALEARRKDVKAQIEAPYKAFNEVYEDCVSTPFKLADNTLKKKIAEVEDGLKRQKKEKVLAYAKELKASYALDWLDIERVLPNVTLSASVHSLTSAVAERLDKISLDCQCISEIDNADESAEILSEYKKTLNLAQAKLTVSERKKEIEKAKTYVRKTTEQEEIKHKAEQKIEMLAPPVIKETPLETLVEDSKKYQMTFTVRGTKENLKELKAFIVNNNIEIIGGK